MQPERQACGHPTLATVVVDDVGSSGCSICTLAKANGEIQKLKEGWVSQVTELAGKLLVADNKFFKEREASRGLVEALKRINPEHLQKLLDDTRWMLAVTPEALRDIIERMGRLKEALAKYQTQGSGEKAEIDEIRNQYLDGVKNQKPVIFSVDKGVGKDATVTAPSPAKESALE